MSAMNYQCLCCCREFEWPRLLCVDGCSGWVDRKPGFEGMTIRTVSAQKRPTPTETNVNEQRTEGDSGMNRRG